MALRNPRQDSRRQKLEQLAKLEALKYAAKPVVQPTPIPAPAKPIKVEEPAKPFVSKKPVRTADIVQEETKKVAE